MGRYIQVPGPKNKVKQLQDAFKDVTVIPGPPLWKAIPPEMALVCVVDNGPFEAAMYCDTEDQLERARRPDTNGAEFSIKAYTADHQERELNSEYEKAKGLQRPRTWLLMRREDAENAAV